MTKNLSLASAFAVHGLAARAGTHVIVDPVCSVGIFITGRDLFRALVGQGAGSWLPPVRQAAVVVVLANESEESASLLLVACLAALSVGTDVDALVSMCATDLLDVDLERS